jgi:hypothetical protein
MQERSVLGRGALGPALLFVVPLFVIYELGILSHPFSANGVDLISRWIYDAVGHSENNFVLFHLAIAIVFAYTVYRLRERISFARAGLVLVEAAVYAAVMVAVVMVVLRIGFSTGDAVVASAGAGVHEELFFRLGIMGGGAWLLRACGVRHAAAVGIALVGSAVIFSAAHHVGPGGQPWELAPFLFRTVSGLWLGAIAYYRSFAHAVYTHFAYDVFVMTY